MGNFKLKLLLKRNTFTLLVVMLFPIIIYGQNNSRIDSLNNQLKSNKLNDTSKINIYNELCWPLYSSLNSDSSIRYSLKVWQVP